MKKRERGSGAAASRFVIDTNVIVSALESLLREPREEGINSLSLLVRLIVGPSTELFGNQILLHEYERFAEELNSDTLTQIINELTAKVQLVEIPDDALRRCLGFFSEGDAKDVFHAATCLIAGAVLITNDRDFDSIRDAGLIEVWSISQAVRKLLMDELRE